MQKRKEWKRSPSDVERESAEFVQNENAMSAGYYNPADNSKTQRRPNRKVENSENVTRIDWKDKKNYVIIKPNIAPSL